MSNALRTSLSSRTMLVAPGVADTLSALAAERAGFPAVFLSGSAVAQTHLGRPDIGLTNASELVAITRRITERAAIPVFADIDTGFGNAFNVFRTVRSMAVAGAAGIQMEDQQTVKALATVRRRPVISLADMQVKIRAAQDARGEHDLLISARTDARYEQGLNSAIERAQAYAECGADLIFVEGLSRSEERAALAEALGPEVPRVFNAAILETAIADTLQSVSREGYRMALVPTWITTAVVQALTRSLTDLVEQCPAGSVAGGKNAGETDVATLIGASEHLQRADRWSTPGE